MHIHEHRVIHFDLKPANILLTTDKHRAKIIGFKFAVTGSTLAIAPNEPPRRGTTPFMAPELFSGLYRESSACDVYSFAVVLAELWSGTLAWEGTPEGAISEHVTDGQRPFLARDLAALGVPASIIALIEACWAQNPYIRPTFAQLAGLSENFDQTKQGNWPYFIPPICSAVSPP
jgi:serine/threonine protein kinase